MRLSVQIEFDKILDLETNKNAVIVGRSSGDGAALWDGLPRLAER